MLIVSIKSEETDFIMVKITKKIQHNNLSEFDLLNLCKKHLHQLRKTFKKSKRKNWMFSYTVDPMLISLKLTLMGCFTKTITIYICDIEKECKYTNDFQKCIQHIIEDVMTETMYRLLYEAKTGTKRIRVMEERE